MGSIFAACTAAVMLMLAVGPALAVEPTLAAVKQRGELVCGINGQLPGFSSLNAERQWTGFEVDMCRTVAAAALGDAGKVRFVPLTTADRFDALRNGQIDVLMRNSTATLERTVRTGVRDATIIYIDGQAVVVAKKSGVTGLAELHDTAVCTLKGTPYQQRLQDWLAARKLAIKVAIYDVQSTMYEALYAGTCAAVTQDISALASTIVASGRAADFLVLPEIIATDPLAAYVRAGDDEWFDVVRWTRNALLEAEQHGITSASVDAERTSGNPVVRRLLGIEPGYGKLLGLDESWAFNAIKQVGNYSEIYERNVGAKSPLGFARGVNALWSSSGALYPLAMR